MKNALTVDVEDWYQCMVFDYRTWPSYEDRIVHSTTKVLDMLRDAGVRATFFVLGYVAETHPELVERIAADGHEVENHGQHHEFVYKLTPDEFRADLERSGRAIEQAIGRRPTGYRAPFFSITERNWWAFDVLAEMGFCYDSSVYPVHNHRYGVPGASRFSHRVQAQNQASLVELPTSTVRMGINWPVGGGVYFRAMPYALIKRAVGRVNREGRPAILYFHPWEIDPEQPVLEGLNPLFKARRYLNLDKAESKWRSLLRDFSFAPVGEVFRQEIYPSLEA